MAECGQCQRWFSSVNALNAHCRDKADHFFCEECDRFFVHDGALEQVRFHPETILGRLNNSGICALKHLAYSAVHQGSYDSDESPDYSEEEEESDDSDEQEPYCTSCKRWFVDLLSLNQHLVSSPRHNWCFICSRDFRTENGLDQHMSSPVHRNRDFECPLCRSAFKTPSSIAHHVESGACHNISRHQVTAAVHRLSITPAISLSHRIAGYSAPRTITHYSATELAFNGNAYECYLCHRTFRTLAGLNAHLDSPAHDADEFKCPKCKRQFKLVSGLIQHVESEACGLARFKQVEDQTRALTAQFTRMLTF
ncbi:hypothetical protein DENSPDRAFT_769372 [Dentipellis sp. KUC8613]|nr:hypothetical protein DENSPDRAFT_769372 [Dentipellis sp. KUC8613]